MAQAADLEEVKKLLSSVGLPTEDLNPALPNFLLAFVNGALAGTAGVEVTGEVGLLRSVAVSDSYRNYGIARRLVADLTKQVRLQGVKSLYLITTTADRYFEKQDFMTVKRDEVPVEVAQSTQFSGLCPSSAVVMKKEIGKPKIKLNELATASSCCSPSSGCC
ncbi:MAG: arsenic resistance N-acetyltransferase ArsN2 [Spirosomaceae bacterium]|nr:arsenic resistance N-acetyltransferase ArsN2 [Spirosomataceae bacterium]